MKPTIEEAWNLILQKDFENDTKPYSNAYREILNQDFFLWWVCSEKFHAPGFAANLTDLPEKYAKDLTTCPSSLREEDLQFSHFPDTHMGLFQEKHTHLVYLSFTERLSILNSF